MHIDKRWPSAILAAAALTAFAVSPALAQAKTAAQYTAEAEAYEAQADKLLQQPQGGHAPVRPVVVARAAARIAPGDAMDGGGYAGMTLRVGVYGCMDQDARELVALQWGVIDASTYSTYDGGRGAYKYDASTAILTFQSGFFKGLKRKRMSEISFRVLDEHGALTAFNCPWEPKDPKKLHW